LSKTITDMVRDLGNAARLQSVLSLSDAELLEQFAVRRSETAFEALLHRHGPLVFGVCRRMLFDTHDAEDAFQATFLVLARKAGSIAGRSLLSNWLYGVALRVATRARKNAYRRRMTERQDVDLTAVAGMERLVDPDLAPLLHEEVQRLPEKYRCPVVLCYLEGKTNAEAADQLRWPVGTVKTRLDKARELLRTRLARRGVALTATLLAANLLPAAVPAAVFGGTFQSALSFAAGNAIAGGAASAQALTLAMGVLRTMMLAKVKTIVAAVLAVIVATGVGGLSYRGLALEPAAVDGKKGGKAKEDKDAILGEWNVEKLVMDGEDATDTEEGKRFKSGPMTFTAKKIVLEGAFEMPYRLDATAKPKTMDLDHGGGKTFDCVYSLDGNTLKICGPIVPGGNRPTEVDSKKGSDTRLLVLKRKVKEKK
jgi:RNA polymerase sigma factor (sigma-70 family)